MRRSANPADPCRPALTSVSRGPRPAILAAVTFLVVADDPAGVRQADSICLRASAVWTLLGEGKRCRFPSVAD